MKHRKALLKTLEYVEKHPKKLDMEIWKCGSVACLAGHYCLQNPRAELKLAKDNDNSSDDQVYFCPVIKKDLRNGRINADVSTSAPGCGLKAVSKHFGISRYQAEKIFLPREEDNEYVSIQTNFLSSEIYQAQFCVDKFLGRVRRLIAKL